MQEASACLSRNYRLPCECNLKLWSLWASRCSGLTFVIGASMVMEWIRAIEEYRLVCKLGAAKWREPQSVNQTAAFEQCRRLGHSTTKYSLVSHFFCISSPCKFFIVSFLVLLCASLAATPHFCCQIFHPSFTSERSCTKTSCPLIVWISIIHGSSCKSVSVPHLGGTAALMKTIPAPHEQCFTHCTQGQKEISATIVPP